MKETKRAVIYARYSSDKQTETSIEGQIAECQKYADANDMLIVKEYIDRAKSATTDKRPGFQKMIADSDNGLFDIILVYQLDRFARNRYDSGFYKKILADNGVRVLSVKEPITDDNTWIFTESMLDAFSEYFSQQLALKVSRGMYQNAEKCKYNGGTMTYGYKVDENGYYALDEEKAPIVKEIFDRIADGETAISVCEDLNKRGIRTIRGKPFGKNSLQNMLRNEKYRGVYQFGTVRVPEGIPRIVDDTLFDQVQDALARRSHRRRPASENYLLTGKLYCGYCKKPMVGTSGTSRNGTTHRYYICYDAPDDCQKKPVQKDFLETQVLKLCRNEITEEVKEAVLASVEQFNKEDNLSPEFLRLKKSIAETEAKIEKLIDQVESGTGSERFAARPQQREDDLARLKMQLRKEERKQLQIDPEIIQTFFRALQDNKYLHKAVYRKMLISLFVDRIYLFDDHVDVYFNYTEDGENAGEEVRKEADAYFLDSGSEEPKDGVPNKNSRQRLLFFYFCYYMSKGLEPERAEAVSEAVL